MTKFFGGALLSMCLLTILVLVAQEVLAELHFLSETGAFKSIVIIGIIAITGGLGTHLLSLKEEVKS